MKNNDTANNIIEKIDITYLKPDINNEVLKKYIDLCKAYSFYGLCLPIEVIIDNYDKLSGLTQKLVTVIGFPLGYNSTYFKKMEISYLKNVEIDEFDVVVNLYKYFCGERGYVKKELIELRELTKDKIMKVIIETSYLSDNQILDLTSLFIECGVDYVKTSTGFAPDGAKVEHIQLIKKKFGDNIKIKASGGIRTYEDALMMIKAGADRLGMSNVLDIVKRYG